MELLLNNVQHKCVSCSKTVTVTSAKQQDEVRCNSCLIYEKDVMQRRFDFITRKKDIRK
jgi:hypothetical protein